MILSTIIRDGSVSCVAKVGCGAYVFHSPHFQMPRPTPTPILFTSPLAGGEKHWTGQ